MPFASVADDEETLLLLSLGASARLVTSRYDGMALIAALSMTAGAIGCDCSTARTGTAAAALPAGVPADQTNT